MQLRLRYRFGLSIYFVYNLLQCVQCCDDKECNFIAQLREIVEKKSPDLRAVAQLHSSIEQLQQIQKQHPFLRLTSQERLNRLPALQQWCEKRMNNGLRIKKHPLYDYGVFVTRDISPDEQLFDFKINETISNLGARALLPSLARVLTPPENAQREEHELWTQHAWVALQLIVERLRNDSMWTPYLNMLPTENIGSLSYETSELFLLVGSEAYSKAVALYRTVVQQYIKIFQHLLQDPKTYERLGLTRTTFTFDLYRWALSIVYTRSCANERAHLVIPCWDFCNHGPSLLRSKTFYETKLGPPTDVRIYATKQLVIGQELTLNYMPHHADMASFFHNWGIIFASGSIDVKLTLQPGDPLYRSKLRRLTRTRTFEHKIVVYQSPDLLLNPTDLKTLAIFGSGELHARPYAWHFLAKHLRHYSSKYRFTSHSAEVMLLQNSLTAAMKLALKEVIAELQAIEYMRLMCVAKYKKRVS